MSINVKSPVEILVPIGLLSQKFILLKPNIESVELESSNIALFKSPTVPDVEVSQNISKSDSTGSVSYIANF